MLKFSTSVAADEKFRSPSIQIHSILLFPDSISTSFSLNFAAKFNTTITQFLKMYSCEASYLPRPIAVLPILASSKLRLKLGTSIVNERRFLVQPRVRWNQTFNVSQERRIRLGFDRCRVCGLKRDEGETYLEVAVEPVVEGGDGGEKVWLSTDVKARLYLLLVPLMWGSYGPALRFIYSQPLAPSASIITLSRKVASVAFFLLLQPLEKAVKKSNHNGAAISVSEPIAGNSWVAAAELGWWTFLGTALQTYALGSTTAIRAGFILQTITVLVPLLSAVSGSRVSKITWGSALLALTGVVLMSMFGNEGAAAGGSISSLFCSEGSSGCQSAIVGDLEVLAAAFFYAINTIRLGVHAKKMSALELSTRVMVVSSAFTFAWAGYDYLSATLDGRDGRLAWQGLTSPEVLGATIFGALVPGTLAHLAQFVGQRTVPPSEAQVYYSLQPVWAALFSAVLLHETMSPLAWGAGGLIVFAALLAGTQNS